MVVVLIHQWWWLFTSLVVVMVVVILGDFDADRSDQILFGKGLTRSTNSIFLS